MDEDLTHIRHPGKREFARALHEAEQAARLVSTGSYSRKRVFARVKKKHGIVLSDSTVSDWFRWGKAPGEWLKTWCFVEALLDWNETPQARARLTDEQRLRADTQRKEEQARWDLLYRQARLPDPTADRSTGDAWARVGQTDPLELGVLRAAFPGDDDADDEVR
ncbi:hypothetical protein ACWCXB_17120 [Streptomyces sp. NPDC001514]